MTSEKKQKNGAETNSPEVKEEKSPAAQTGEQAMKNSPEHDGAPGENKPESAENFEEKHNILNDKFLRLAAEFDNYKKRAEKEKQQAQVAGMREMTSSIFQTLDSLELALRHGSQSEVDGEGLIRGVRLTYEQSVSQLKNFGIVQLSAEVGEKFNPALHQAIENRPSEDVNEGHIAQEIAKGYTAGETLIRPVVVAVSSGPEKESPEKPSGDKKREQ